MEREFLVSRLAVRLLLLRFRTFVFRLRIYHSGSQVLPVGPRSTLLWVVLTWSCGDVDEIAGAPSDCSPPCCFEIYEGNVSFSSVFYCVWREGPTFSSRNTRHNEEILVLMLRYHGTLALT